jgi:hypothetical protein
MQKTTGGSPVAGGRDFSHAEMRTIEAVALAARIPNFNANVSDGVFIAPAGLTPCALIGKHKVKVAAQHASSREKFEADRNSAKLKANLANSFRGWAFPPNVDFKHWTDFQAL